MMHTINYRGLIAPELPFPILYVASAHQGDDTDRYLVPMVRRLGLPALRLEGDPDTGAQLRMDKAKGSAWGLWIGGTAPRYALVVQYPTLGANKRIMWDVPDRLIYGGGIDTPDWCEAALKAEACLLVVGPPWQPGMGDGRNDLERLGDHAWKAGGALGHIPAGIAPADPHNLRNALTLSMR